MFSIMKGINICSRCAECYRNNHLSQYQLTGNHYAYLLNICRNPGISQEHLSRLLCINKSNVARQLVILEKIGYLTRKPSTTDKRITLIFPTQKAQDLLPEIRRTLRSWNDYITEDFTGEERLLLSSMIEKITKKSMEYLYDRKEET